MRSSTVSTVATNHERPQIRTAVLFHDQPSISAHGIDITCWLKNLFGPAAQILCSWHSFEQLGGDYAGAIAKEAATADTVIYAFAETPKVSPETKSWIERWLSKNPPLETKLAVVFQNEIANSAAAIECESYFRHIANESGFDFLKHKMGLRETFPNPFLSGSSPSEVSLGISGVIRKADPVYHWGINE